MNRIELSAGTIEYGDTGGDGQPIVFIHGLTIDGSVWRNVVARLAPDFRCITPTLPLGSHRIPMRADADLTIVGMAALVGEFLDALDLHDAILVQNDWGGVQVLIAHRPVERVAGLVLTSCEAFDNYPPGLPGRALTVAAAIPGGFAAMMQVARFAAFRRAPGGWGWMSKRPVPKAVMDRWFEPARENAEVRRDLLRYATSVPPKPTLAAWAEANRRFTKPVLVVWGNEDKIMPPEHGRRLAELYPDSRLVELDDTYTLIPEDRPDALADAIRRRFQPDLRAR